jgi:hypothetical protein
MNGSQFKITPTPPASIALDPGEEDKLSFTNENLAAPDQICQVVLQALLVGDDGKGKEVDWLVAGPERTLRMRGGQTETATLTAHPTAGSPRGTHRVKLRVADQERPNDVYADSPPVQCEVRAPGGTKKATGGLPGWLLGLVLAALLLGLVGTGLGLLGLSCGGPDEATCIDCPEGPRGPAGARGPTGPAGARGSTGPAGADGPRLKACRWLFNGCNSPAGVECARVCPRGTHPVAGSCDITGGGTVVENRASVAAGTRFPASGSPFTAFDRWVCEASAGRVQSTYALCCEP